MVHAIDKELYSCIEQLSASEKKSVLDMIRSYVLQSRKKITLEEYNKDIEESEKDIEEGKSYTQEDVVRISKSWTSAG